MRITDYEAIRGNAALVVAYLRGEHTPGVIHGVHEHAVQVCERHVDRALVYLARRPETEHEEVAVAHAFIAVPRGVPDGRYLAEAVAKAFLQARPRWAESGEAGDPGLCEYASHELVGFAAVYGIDGEVDLLSQTTDRNAGRVAQPSWLREGRYPEEALNEHYVARLGAWAVDLTARQYDEFVPASLPFPHIWLVETP